MYTYQIGNVEESLSIMREAAQWLIDKGCPLWEIGDLTPEKISTDPDEYIVMWRGDESVATLVLRYYDGVVWPNIPSGTSGFIHKLSIRRKYAGAGLAKEIVQFAIASCKRRGIAKMRLDCDNRSALCRFYENLGFTQKEVKRMGRYAVVLYELDLPI